MELVMGKTTVEYAPRTVWRVGENFERTDESSIEDALNYHRFALLLGLSGVGKSTTAEYVARRFAENGKIAIRLIPMGEGSRIGVEVTGYDVLRVYFPIGLGVEERFLTFANALSKLSDVRKRKSKDRGFLKRIVGLFEKVKELKGSTKKEIAKEMSKTVKSIAESFEDFECGILDEEKLVTFFELVRSVSMDLGILSAKNILDFVGGMLPRVSVIVTVLLFLTGLIEMREIVRRGDLGEEVERRLRKGAEGKDVLLIVDDYADTRDFAKRFYDFLNRCHEVGIRVLVVRRIELKDFMKISKSRRRIWNCVNLFRGGDSDEPLWGRLDRRALERCVFIMDRCEFREFVEIVRNNWHVIVVKRERLGKEVNVCRIDLKEWYRKTFGIPFLALTLMCYRDAGELRVRGKEGTYYKRSFFELDEEEAEELNDAMVWRFLEVFESVWKDDFVLVPVILQPVSEDEAEEFLGRRGVEELEFHPCVKEYYREVREDREVRVFELREENLKLHELFELLEDIDAKIDGRSVRELIGRWRHSLLKIMTEKAMRYGWVTRRMLYSALKHLMRIGDRGMEDWFLFWLGLCLSSEPDLGIMLAEEGLEVAKRRGGAFALAFLAYLAGLCSSYEIDALKIWKVIEGIECGTLAERGWKVIAKASALRSIYIGSSLIVKTSRGLPWTGFLGSSTD